MEDECIRFAIIFLGIIIAIESEYNTKKANGENIYIAQFVGCTYHCG